MKYSAWMISRSYRLSNVVRSWLSMVSLFMSGMPIAFLMCLTKQSKVEYGAIGLFYGKPRTEGFRYKEQITKTFSLNSQDCY